MSDDTVDLTLLGTAVRDIERELRLLRLQVDSIAQRGGALDARVAGLEQSFHGLVGEVSRGFGQVEQQMARLEKRVEALDAGLTGLRGELAASTDKIIEAIGSIKHE